MIPFIDSREQYTLLEADQPSRVDTYLDTYLLFFF